MTIHRIKLKDLDAKFIQQLREELQDDEAELAIWLSDKPSKGVMTETEFWKILSLSDWKKEGDDEAILAQAVQYLSELSVPAIEAFEDILSEKLYLLDGQQYAENIGDNAYQGEGLPFSADEFLYARCFVVAKGEDFFRQVLEHPQDMPKDRTFEPLLGLAERAYQHKTSENFNYIPAYIIETFANAEGWNGKGFIEKIFSS